MQVELTPEERDLLLHLVDVAVRDMSPEIRHTDSRAYRDELKQQRRELQHLHDVLAAARPDAVASGGGDSSTTGIVGTP